MGCKMTDEFDKIKEKRQLKRIKKKSVSKLDKYRNELIELKQNPKFGWGALAEWLEHEKNCTISICAIRHSFENRWPESGHYKKKGNS
jgi:hypothetical protein